MKDVNATGDSRWDRHWMQPVATVRSELFFRVVLLMVGLDAWLVMLPHDGRYGWGFNVAHFAWIDAAQPAVTPELRGAVVAAVGLLATTLAVLGGVRRGALAALAILYTYGWAMSQLDSYQHHWLLTLMLVCFVVWPAPDRKSAEVAGQPAWPYTCVCTCIGLVYICAGLSKLEPGWRSGAVVGFLLEPVGLGGAAGWVALATVPLQVAIGLAYLAAGYRDTGPPWLRRALALAWFPAVAFHVGAEVLELQIGWFSYYMIATASIALLPQPWLELAAKPLGWTHSDGARVRGPIVTLAFVFAAAAVITGVGMVLDVPGAGAGALICGLIVVASALVEIRQGRRYAMDWVTASLLSTAAVWALLALSSARYDYYRYVGGEARRRGDVQRAIEAYAKAVRYAKTDRERESKRQRLEELEAL